MTAPDETAEVRYHQIIVVGAGPAGLQLGYFLQRANVDYMILERSGQAGNSFAHLPVHRTLLSINKVNTGIADAAKNMRWDWNSLISEEPELRLSRYDSDFFPQADSYVRYLQEYCRRVKLRVAFNCAIAGIDKEDGQFRLRATDGRQFTCDLLVVATGTSIPYTPPIPGAELAEQYATHDRSVAGAHNKDILILGKGNSAFETAAALLPHAARIHLISPRVLRMAWRTHYPGDLRQINSPFLETFFLKQQNAVLNGTIQSIERVGEKCQVAITWMENGGQVVHDYDRVILCTGFMFDPSAFGGSIRPELVHGGKLPALTYHWESTNVQGLYFCGSLMQSSDYRKSASAFLHGIRYNCQALGKLLVGRLRGVGYPSAAMPADAGQLFQNIYERLRSSSSLWHLYGSLCDAYVFDEVGRRFERLQDVPVRMMAEDPCFSSKSRIEFRFTFERPADPTERLKFTPSGLLHPVLCFFRDGKLVDECHMYEDVYAEWSQREIFGPPFEEALTHYVDALVA